MFEVKLSLFASMLELGGGVALWKSILPTAKAEIGGAAAQIELRGVAEKRRADLVAKVESSSNKHTSSSPDSNSFAVYSGLYSQQS